MNIHLRALGCRLNEAELETWVGDFQGLGHRIVNDVAEADILVLNSCAVTAEAARKSRQIARRLQRENPGARLVLSGCYATLEPEQAAATVGVDLVIGNCDKTRLAEITHRALGLPVMPVMATEPAEIALFGRGRERAFVKIQDGCRYRCTYCIVTVARGEERSRPIDDLVEEIRGLQRAGVQEVVLTGVHVGGYGSDLDCTLADLVGAILARTGIPRLRFASVEPWDLPRGFFDLFENPRLMPHMHLPLQSGSDPVLRRMARRCRTGAFAELVSGARSRVADFNVTTDIIVGFPGETDSEWRQTLRFVERMTFGHIHVFPYSPRSGTKAARLPNPVPKSVTRARCQELNELARRMKRVALQALKGRVLPVLWERGVESAGGGQWCYSGYTPSYHRVSADSDRGDGITGTIGEVRITGSGDSAALGSFV